MPWGAPSHPSQAAAGYSGPLLHQRYCTSVDHPFHILFCGREWVFADKKPEAHAAFVSLLPVHTPCLPYKRSCGYVTLALSWVFRLLHAMVSCSGGQSEWWAVPGGALGARHCTRGECVGAWRRYRRGWLSAIPAQDEPATAAQVGTLHCVNCAKHAVVFGLMPIFMPDLS